MRAILLVAVAACAACGAGDNRVDPEDLELRDLLGMAPDVAVAWDAEQRASAKAMFDDVLDEPPEQVDLAKTPELTRAIAMFDATRATRGHDAAGLVVGGMPKRSTDAITLELSDRWTIDPAPARDRLLAIAETSGAHGTVVVMPAPRLASIVGFDAATNRLLVNPVWIATFASAGAISIPDTDGAPGVSENRTNRNPGAGGANEVGGGDRPIASTGGNPYSFYGSVAECAAAQRSRCDACRAGGDCKAVTETDGIAECDALDANGGEGHYLICINLSLAIGAVADCAEDRASSCARVTDAASKLDQLGANRSFLEDPTCAMALDACLSSIYGAPSGSFPSPDGGVVSDPPRNTSVSCGDGCSNDNCSFDPTCNGPTCGNSFSCDSTCSSSTDQSGCGGNCDGCKSSGGGTGNGGGGCSDGGSSSSGGCGGSSGDGDSCSSSSSSSSSSGCGGGSSSSSSSGCGGSSSGGGCGGGSSGGGGCGGGGGGGGGGGCAVAQREPSGLLVLATSVTWGVLPVPLAAFIRRRAKKRAKTAAGEEVAS